MNKKRIQEVADFFYSSSSSRVVPLRISCTTGMAGFDLGKDRFIELMDILSNSKNLKKDLKKFADKF